MTNPDSGRGKPAMVSLGEYRIQRRWRAGAIGITMGLTMAQMSDDPQSIAEILADLRSQHRDLDRAIDELAGNPAADQLQVGRLKKRKLRIKDQIAYWESRQIPDLDA